ncbi:hypothetical protein [Fervidobacterium sp. 2310opik-2]|uniref:hypothetical protein n=1 Tax=Fervidobacterium sp. 2310opik-2 TaxID=1755815 RepID=UPI0013E06AF5|nr:hypothetical protein [Fervidobacterium sp. 2310opik-2]KAF2962141.1 hypothetical protein AS161_05495 [Fervidobacterium sp. 2310opik-2]
MKLNTLVIVFLVLMLLLFLDIFSKNFIANSIHTILYKSSTPIYSSKRNLEKLFEKEKITLNVTLFKDTTTNALEVLSEDSKGIYVLNLKKKGIVVDATTGELIGFVEKTGNVGYAIKWWEKEFPVTIESIESTNESTQTLKESTDTQVYETYTQKTVGYYSNYRIDLPDPNIKINGKVYISEYIPYGRLLKNNNISIGEYSNGIFRIKIPTIPKYVVLLEDYTINDSSNNSNGGK